MEQPRKYVARSREADEIARDIDRTQMRIDATLDALQRRLKPSNLAKEAAKRLAGSGAQTFRQLADRIMRSEQGVRAQRLIADAQRTIALLPPGDAQAIRASAQIVAARLIAARAQRGQMIKLGAAALGTVLAAAAVAAIANGAKNQATTSPRTRKPAKRRAKAAARSSAKPASRRRSSPGRRSRQG